VKLADVDNQEPFRNLERAIFEVSIFLLWLEIGDIAHYLRNVIM
jgi:hypothetical protein